MGGQANGQACADGERGPPSVRAEVSFLSVPHTFLPEGVVLGLRNFARSFKSQTNKIWGPKKFRSPPRPWFGLA